MRKYLFILLAVFTVIISIPMNTKGEVDLFSGHYLPMEIKEGDDVDLFVVVRDTNNSGIDRVYARMEEQACSYAGTSRPTM